MLWYRHEARWVTAWGLKREVIRVARMDKKNERTARPEFRYSFLRILSGSDLSRRRIPMMSAVSPKSGPVVWLTACVHGDEVSGIVVVQEIFRRLRKELRCGTVLAFPLLNPIGFEMGSRSIAVSGDDLNRSFPGDAQGTLGQRIAHQIFGKIVEAKPAVVIDLHNDWNASIPYVVLDHPSRVEKSAVYKQSVEFAMQSGFCVISETEEIGRSLSFSLLMAQVPAITFELGKANVVSESLVTSGVSAVWNILAGLGMVSAPDEAFVYSVPAGYGGGRMLHYWDRPFASRTGIIRFLAKPGDTVKAGDPLARIVNAFGRLQETVVAQHDGLVLGHTDSSAAHPGKSIMAFGISRREA